MVVIRKAIPSDSEAIASCLLIAMEDIVFRFIGKDDPQLARDFMLFFVSSKGNQYSYENCWVALENDRVVGAVNVYDGALLAQLRQPVIDYLHIRHQRTLIAEDETQAGEFYLDTIGVLPSVQGMGIGSKLLHFVVDDFVVKRHRTLGLLVDDENPNAKRLYLKVGFKSAGKKIFLGKSMEHLQAKA